MQGKRPDTSTLVEGLRALHLESLAQADRYADMIATLEGHVSGAGRRSASRRPNPVRPNGAAEPKAYKRSAEARANMAAAQRKRFRNAKRKR